MATLLLEVGTEELPASFVRSAMEQWQSLIPNQIQELGIPAASLRLFATPRRLAVLLSQLPERQPDRLEILKGPPAQPGDGQGSWSAAAQGFARKHGVSLGELQIQTTEKGAFVFAQKRTAGKPLADVFLPLLPSWITSLKGERLMRWGAGELKFPRPIRWLTCLLDDQVLPIALENVVADRLTWGHRVLHPQPIALSHAEDYEQALEQAGVMADPHKRQELIHKDVVQAARNQAGYAWIPENLLAEVTQLVEWPTAVVGQFDPLFLDLPAPVITMVMTSHQRYFPVYADPDYTQLLPYFITVSNGDPDKSAGIAAGNSRVIRARLADADFFYREDQKTPLQDRIPQLAKVTFVEELGSLADKVNRITQLCQGLGDLLHLDGATQALIQRTAQLCKADLVTQMVYEFPELQGVMGSDYARLQGEHPLVAQGIAEHYAPHPTSITGAVVGMADRLDTLVGLFHLGRIPTGSSDRFALRRAANIVIGVVVQQQWHLSLLDSLDLAKTAYGIPQIPESLLEFFSQRLRAFLQEEFTYDVVNAVLPEADLELRQVALGDPLHLLARAQTLQTWRENGTLATLYASVTRCVRLANQGSLAHDIWDPDAVVKALHLPAEQALWSACRRLPATNNLEELGQAFATMVPEIERFFAEVLVMDPDPEIRSQRLNLLGIIRNHSRRIGDWLALVV